MNDASQDERRAIIAADAERLKVAIDKGREPSAPSTYFEQAKAELEREAIGTGPALTGLNSPNWPVANWNVDPVPAEPPLGIDVNELPDLGMGLSQAAKHLAAQPHVNEVPSSKASSDVAKGGPRWRFVNGPAVRAR